MRIALFSDSHGDAGALRMAAEAVMGKGQVDWFVFLGDGIQDFLDLQPLFKKHNPLAHMQAVRGNNDFARMDVKEEAAICVGGVWLFAAHGHRQRVKMTDRLLLQEARERKCRAALFGHTHRALCQEKEGILLFNPGSVSLPVGSGPTAGLLTITREGVLQPQIIHL